MKLLVLAVTMCCTLHRFPHEFIELPFKEKAFVIASIDIRIENEKEQQSKLKK